MLDAHLNICFLQAFGNSVQDLVYYSIAFMQMTEQQVIYMISYLLLLYAYGVLLLVTTISWLYYRHSFRDYLDCSLMYLHMQLCWSRSMLGHWMLINMFLMKMKILIAVVFLVSYFSFLLSFFFTSYSLSFSYCKAHTLSWHSFHRFSSVGGNYNFLWDWGGLCYIKCC